MATGKRPSGKKDQVRRVHASYLSVKNGQKEAGYKAGEIFGCPGHRTHAHQPCCFALTDGALQCPYCTAGLDQVFRAYVPLWDRDWSLRYCLIGEDHFDSADVIPLHAQIVCVRAKNPISPLVVREELTFTRKLPDQEPYSKAVSMLDICLTLWKDDALAQWFKLDRVEAMSDNPLSVTKSDGEAFGPMTAAAARRWAKPAANKSEPKTADGEVARLLKHAAETVHNGNGKPKPK